MKVRPRLLVADDSLGSESAEYTTPTTAYVPAAVPGGAATSTL